MNCDLMVTSEPLTWRFLTSNISVLLLWSDLIVGAFQARSHRRTVKRWEIDEKLDSY